MKKTLTGKKVAILVTEGFEQVELTEPRQALLDAGAEAKIITPKGGKIRAWNTDDFGDTFDSDLVLDQAKPEDFDALLLPGGVMNPDKLRAIPEAVTSPLSLRCRPT
jgi:protease I